MNRLLLLFISLSSLSVSAQKMIKISKASLQDKIKGGWAGQVIGVTFGGPTEFHFNGTMINDYQTIPWYDGYIKHTMTEEPGLYDDLYMDLTFVDVLEKEGLDAPVSSYAQAYAKAGYRLWHANQAGRYNILNGVPAPKSGHWLNNPHADDIDFQIEADFSGLMSPGMPNTAAKIGDPIGHIMNYGDGWYGGVFVGALYSISFISSDVPLIVNEALKTIPSQSTFYQCVSDVVQWHKKYPDDWKQTWFEIQKKWSDERGCPDGVFHAFNIDAKINAAYIVLGLLYGKGDFTKTMEITARAGQDSDCNPSSAGGILGTILGYNQIPAYWKQGLKEAEDINFKYTTISLNRVYDLSFQHALKVVARNGGQVHDSDVTILAQNPVAVRLEQSFTGHFPTTSIPINKNITTELGFDVQGIGFVIRGEAAPQNGNSWDYAGDFAFTADLFVDGQKIETASLPVSFITRRHELFWKYQLSNAKHAVKIVLTNPQPDYRLQVNDVLVYDDQPIISR